MSTEADIVEKVARSIAEEGFGRPWDDFLPLNAHDTDQADLMDYARAALKITNVERDAAARDMRERCAKTIEQEALLLTHHDAASARFLASKVRSISLLATDRVTGKAE